jgi:cell wall-associated NlpC family hydrolase
MNTDLLKQYALSFVGIPYHWNGKSPMSGFDCSGLVSEILKVANVLLPHDEPSSQQLFDKFSQNGAWNILKSGSLAFYGKDSKNITHVAFLVDSDVAVESAGGDETTTTLQQAIAQNAFVKVRNVKYRNDLIGIVRPKYYWEQGL